MYYAYKNYCWSLKNPYPYLWCNTYSVLATDGNQHVRVLAKERLTREAQYAVTIHLHAAVYQQLNRLQTINREITMFREEWQCSFYMFSNSCAPVLRLLKDTNLLIAPRNLAQQRMTVTAYSSASYENMQCQHPVSSCRYSPVRVHCQLTIRVMTLC